MGESFTIELFPEGWEGKGIPGLKNHLHIIHEHDCRVVIYIDGVLCWVTKGESTLEKKGEM